MKTMLMLISDGMEECEALVTRDVLLRAGINVLMYSTNNKEEVKSQNSLLVKRDIKKYNLEDYDGIILPGGGLGTKNLNEYKEMDNILKHFFDNNKLVCAICAAPTVLGKRGYLHNKNYTCFSGCEVGLDGKHNDVSVCQDENIITARSMYFANEFGLKIIQYLLGDEKAIDVEKKIKSDL